MRVIDCILVAATGVLAYVTRFDGPPAAGVELYAMITGVILAANVFEFRGVYRGGTIADLIKSSHRIYGGWAWVLLLLIVVGFATEAAGEVSRLWAGLWFAYGLVALAIWRTLLRMKLRQWQDAGILVQNMAIVGSEDHCARFIDRASSSGGHGYRIIGIFLLNGRDDPADIAGYPVRGGIADLRAIARTVRIDRVVVAMPLDADEDLEATTRHLGELPSEVCLFPAVGPTIPCRRVTHGGGVPLLHIADKPLNGWGAVIKEMEDRLLAPAVLLMAAPVMLLTVLAIWLESGRPILFRQKRYGFNNEVIEVLKFRTMWPEPADGGEAVVQARRDDPRVTRIGRFLRRSSLDELPQFINVLRGEMSIVGPRPHAVAHHEHYAAQIDSYLARHRMKPGITGWAQVNGLRGETRTLDKMKRRVAFDLYYIENWSLMLDIRIIFKTLRVGLIDPHAY